MGSSHISLCTYQDKSWLSIRLHWCATGSVLTVSVKNSNLINMTFSSYSLENYPFTSDKRFINVQVRFSLIRQCVYMYNLKYFPTSQHSPPAWDMRGSKTITNQWNPDSFHWTPGAQSLHDDITTFEGDQMATIDPSGWWMETLT